jgi:hypothetical protein
LCETGRKSDVVTCKHPRCTGRHSNSTPIRERCPAAVQRKNEWSRKRYSNLNFFEKEAYRILTHHRRSNARFVDAGLDPLSEGIIRERQKILREIAEHEKRRDPSQPLKRVTGILGGLSS